MRGRLLLLGALVVSYLAPADVRQVWGDQPENQAVPGGAFDPQATRHAIERGLAFLENDVAQWRKEHECATCHHGVMTVWAYSEATRRGFAVKAETVAETVEWAKKRFFDRIDKPRDTRPGWSMVSTPAIYFAMMAQCVDQQEAVSADELERIADHLIRHQEADGSWAWSSAPPINRPPPFFESDEVATRWAYLALRPQVAANRPVDNSAVRDSLEKAAAWLAKTAPADTAQAAALRLLMKFRSGESAEAIQSDVTQFLNRQNNDGGWGQLQDLPSDAYATGQALYVLNLVGVKNDRAAIRLAVAFLVANQREDGSWPMKSRAHPGATPYQNPVPITYFGSAWATLGLVRSVAKLPPEEAAPVDERYPQDPTAVDALMPAVRQPLIIEAENNVPFASDDLTSARGATALVGAKSGDQREVAGIKLCWCPPGTFTMGSPRSEPERRPGEDQVEVTLTKGFWIGKYETTQGDWKRVMGELPFELTAELPEGDNFPVGNVNFAEAEAFCQRLTLLARQSEGLPGNWEFRLPTEAQWEYACRAGTKTATSFGDKLSSKQANFKGKPYNGAELGPSLNRAAKVGSYPANAWGVHDMHGNIFEWCRDWYHARLPGGTDPDLYSAKSSATRNGDGGVSRVRRGGCWADEGWPCRSAFRLRFEPQRRYDHIGFRVVLISGDDCFSVPGAHAHGS